MSTKNIFREVDSLLSYVEAKQINASTQTFEKLKVVESKTINLRSEAIQGFVESKSSAIFDMLRTANRKFEELSGGYIEFLKPAKVGSYAPIGIDVDDIV